MADVKVAVGNIRPIRDSWYEAGVEARKYTNATDPVEAFEHIWNNADKHGLLEVFTLDHDVCLSKFTDGWNSVERLELVVDKIVAIELPDDILDSIDQETSGFPEFEIMNATLFYPHGRGDRDEFELQSRIVDWLNQAVERERKLVAEVRRLSERGRDDY